MSQEKLNRLSYEAQALQEQARALDTQIGELQSVIVDLNGTLLALRGLEQKKGATLVPLGGGVFAKAPKLERETVLVTLGARLVAERPRADAEKLIEQRLQGAQLSIERLQKSLASTGQRLAAVEREAQTIVGGMKPNVRTA